MLINGAANEGWEQPDLGQSRLRAGQSCWDRCLWCFWGGVLCKLVDLIPLGQLWSSSLDTPG